MGKERLDIQKRKRKNGWTGLILEVVLLLILTVLICINTTRTRMTVLPESEDSYLHHNPQP